MAGSMHDHLKTGTWLTAERLRRYPAIVLAFQLAAMLLLAVTIFITHRENIARLLRGQEPRIGAK